MDRQAKQQLMMRLERDAQRICQRFRLSYRVLEPERANVKRRYGVCFSDGTIRIRLNHVTTKKPLKYSSLVNTLCHELAHLRYFNHGPGFQTFSGQILEWARCEGIYRPGSNRAIGAAAPELVQMAALSRGSCRRTHPEPQAPSAAPTAATTAYATKAPALTAQLELFG